MGKNALRVLVISALLVLTGVAYATTETYDFVTSWGTLGTADGQFYLPYSVAADDVGNIYVADSGNNRIQKFANNGTFLTKWGSKGTNNGQFNAPYAIASDFSGNVYVTDSSNNRIQKFSSSGAYIKQWGSKGTGNGQFDLPTGIAVDASGNVYVAEFGNARVQKFNSNGVFLAKWSVLAQGTAGSGVFPKGIAVDPAGNVYVSDWNLSQVLVYDSYGTFKDRWGSYGAMGGQFYGVAGLTTDTHGKIFAAESGNNRVQKLSAVGTSLATIGNPSGTASLSGPQGVATDKWGNVYVTDTGNNRIAKFTQPTSPSTYTITGVVNGGYGTITCTSPINAGGVSTCVIVPGGNYSLSNLTDNASDVTTQVINNVYTISNVQTAHTVTATFGLSCVGNFTIVPTSAQFNQASVSDSVSVMGPSGCMWKAVSNDGWITVTSGTPGDGNGTVGYSVSQNTTTSTRTGTITIAGQTFKVTQIGQTTTYHLTVTKTGTGDCSITDSQGPLTWNGNVGEADYPLNTLVTLIAAPGILSSFVAWTNCDSSSSTQCNVTMTTTKSVTVQCDKIRSVTYDFNGDKKSDLLFTNVWTNDVVIWLVNGLTHSSHYAAQAVPSQWDIMGVGDFDYDGKADILWQHTGTGALSLWFMYGNNISSKASVSTGTAGRWQIKGTGDLNGDGKTDILWQSISNGDVVMWLMDGKTISSVGLVSAALPSQWQIKTVADFNGDGKDDVLLVNNSGDAVIWFMDGMRIVSSDYVIYGLLMANQNGWSILKTGDFNGDGKADILLQHNSTGTIFMWLMDGAKITLDSNIVVFGLPAKWMFRAVGDYNGDGKDDVVWQHVETNEVVVWFMDGVSIASRGVLSNALSGNWYFQ
ncbi:FG-GAP-like repeat-containing protein [Candidatus Magnetobacterium casense]|uniref:VCBS repeat-containing protein n=1 Tax=Candidatus Magnetobacterium casense TaxID=1455061 RepID=A0ABS6RX00_9BACT|nr:FG-GAP-like repeat-containing protein [Candidatus Magnetobacterium casensis]MBV6341164.1 VCBS repeat-containing protein [Candidatus Magnetobacterium casensis]